MRLEKHLRELLYKVVVELIGVKTIVARDMMHLRSSSGVLNTPKS